METQVHAGPVTPPLKHDEHMITVPGLPPMQARHIMIASVHFEPRQERFMHSGRRTFVLPAAPKGGVVYMPVYDSQQAIPTWQSFQQESPEMVPGPVAVETIVKDLEDSWGWIQLKTGNFRLGISRIAGETCTPDEMKRLIGLETTMCRRAVEEADALHQSGDPKGRAMITSFHRACLDWLGSEKREWYHQIEMGRTKTGPLSGQKIPMEALADGSHDLLKWYAGNGLDPADFGDHYISELFKKKPHLRKAAEQK